LNRKKFDEFLRELAVNLNIGLAIVNELIAGLGCKIMCALRVPHQLTPEMKRAKLEPCQQLFTHYKS
jgi:hypothetical protein